MAKKKTMYVCQSCGYDTAKWLGKCPGCGEWNTMVEEIVRDEKSQSRGLSLGLSESSRPCPINEVTVEDLPRMATGSQELDRVLGGGIVEGGLIRCGDQQHWVKTEHAIEAKTVQERQQVRRRGKAA